MLVSVAVFLITTVCLTAFLLNRPVEKERSFFQPKSPVEHSREIAELMTRLTKTNVCRNITPVHIYREEADGQRFLHATGGRSEIDGKIYTSGHGFWNISYDSGKRILPWRYYYQVLEPFATNLFPISRIEVIPRLETNTVGASRDVIRCMPGESQVIAPIPPPPEGTLGPKMHFNRYSSYDTKVVVRSTVTGEEARLLGLCELTNGVFYFLLDYQAFSSQSGTLFASADDQTVYILSRAIALGDESKKIYRLDKSHRVLSLCSGINLPRPRQKPKSQDK